MFIGLLHHSQNVSISHTTQHYIGEREGETKKRALTEQKEEGYRLEGESNQERDEYVLYLFISQEQGQILVITLMKDK